MSHTKISNALSTHLKALVSLSELDGSLVLNFAAESYDLRNANFIYAAQKPVAYENAGYTPTEGTAYIAEHYLPSETSGVGLAISDSLDFTGIYQIDVRTPLDGYKKEGNDIADAVLSHFKRGTVMTFGGQSVVVQSASRAQGRPSGSWWFIPVSINWRAFSGNV